MYTKVFRSIYDGTLADNWQAMVTFQQLLVLANDEGVVDMTIGAIHRTTGIPIDILTAGIAVLEAPDHGSRTPDMEGRRIRRLEDHRDWGWFLVNFKKYRKMVTREEKKEADRERIAQQREAEKLKQNSNVANCSAVSQGVADCSDSSQVSQSVADVAHTEAERDTEAEALEQSSLRSDSSSPDGDDHPADAGKLDLKPPGADRKLTKAERIRQIAEEARVAYNAILAKPHGELVRCSLLNKDRLKAVEKCLPTARAMCLRLYGSERITPEFWAQYFGEASSDDWLSGRKAGGKGHENWKPDVEYLLRENVMAKLFDHAMTETE